MPAGIRARLMVHQGADSFSFLRHGPRESGRACILIHRCPATATYGSAAGSAGGGAGQVILGSWVIEVMSKPGSPLPSFDATHLPVAYCQICDRLRSGLRSVSSRPATPAWRSSLPGIMEVTRFVLRCGRRRLHPAAGTTGPSPAPSLAPIRPRRRHPLLPLPCHGRDLAARPLDSAR